MDRRLRPGWTFPEVEAPFRRPLAAATHWLDHRLSPGRCAGCSGRDRAFVPRTPPDIAEQVDLRPH